MEVADAVAPTTDARLRRLQLRQLKQQRKAREAKLLRQSQLDTNVSPSRDECGDGTALYGNFHRYYSFHSTTDRTQLFSQQMALDIIQRRCQNHNADNVSAGVDDDVTALPNVSPPVFDASELVITYCDIGCNEGDLTVAIIDVIACAFMPKQQTRLTIIACAIDIDDQLITRAQNKHAASRTHTNGVTSHVHFICGDITNADTFDSLYDFTRANVPAGCQRDRFDVISLFSTTMWIHLNHGDAGLEQLLIQLSRHSYFLLLEPQPWSCYQSAVQRRRHAKQLEWDEWERIQHRGSECQTFITKTLTEQGEMECNEVGINSWKRSMLWCTHKTHVNS